MPKFRIAYFTGNYPSLTETFVQREIDYLREQGAEVMVFSLRRVKDIPKGASRSQRLNDVVFARPDNFTLGIVAQIYYLVTNPLGYWKCLWSIFKLFREHPIIEVVKHLGYLHAAAAFAMLLKKSKVEQIHAHFATASSMALFCQYLARIPFSMAAHASADIYYHPILLTEKISAACAVVAENRYNKEYLNLLTARKYTDKIYVVYNGVEVPILARKSKPVNSHIHIVSIAGLRIFKGFPTLLDALAIVRDRGHEFRCSIVGDGPLREQLQEQIRHLALAEQVRLLGALEYEDAQQVLGDADIFVLASEIADSGIRDGIPTVCTEAMAQGIPVISTYVSGIPELVQHDRTGLTVPEKNATLLADAIERLIVDVDLRQRLAVAGYEHVKTVFGSTVTFPQLEKILRECAPR